MYNFSPENLMHPLTPQNFEQLATDSTTSEYALAFRYFLLRLGSAMFLEGPRRPPLPWEVLRSCVGGRELDLDVRPSGAVLLHFETDCGAGCCRSEDTVDVNTSAEQWRGFVDAARVFASPRAIELELDRRAAEKAEEEAAARRREAAREAAANRAKDKRIAEWRTILERGHSRLALSKPESLCVALSKQEYLCDVLLKTSALPGIKTPEQRQWAYERALQVFKGIAQGSGIPAWGNSGLGEAVAASGGGGLLHLCYLRFCDYNGLHALWESGQARWKHSAHILESPGWTALAHALLDFADEPLHG